MHSYCVRVTHVIHLIQHNRIDSVERMKKELEHSQLISILHKIYVNEISRFGKKLPLNLYEHELNINASMLSFNE